MRLRAVKLSLKEINEISLELERVCSFVLAVRLENGLVRVMDNNYHTLTPKDCDPVELYSWLSDLPSDLHLEEFDKIWENYPKT